jgi:selenocysteine lyase/cysteine desulfurase
VQAAARAALAALPGVEMVTPPGPQAGLVAFRLAGCAPDEAAARLAAEGVVVRSVPRPNVLRASVGFFTDEGDLARLEAGVARCLSC